MYDEIVVTTISATSYVDLLQQCMKIAASKNPPIEAQLKQWFIYWFGSSPKIFSGVTLTGCSKFKGMVKARFLPKKNVIIAPMGCIRFLKIEL